VLVNRILEYKPKSELYIDEILKVWAASQKERLPQINEKLQSKLEYLNIIKAFKNTFLFEGYEDHFDKLIPRDSEIVLAHNDA
jgi:hypothetical protein